MSELDDQIKDLETQLNELRRKRQLEIGATTRDRVDLAVANSFGVEVADIRGDSHRHSIVKARHGAWYLLHHYLNWSYGELGAVYERDHSTCMMGVKNLCERLQTNKRDRVLLRRAALEAGLITI